MDYTDPVMPAPDADDEHFDGFRRQVLLAILIFLIIGGGISLLRSLA